MTTYKEAVDQMLKNNLYLKKDSASLDTLQIIVDKLTPHLPHTQGRIKVLIKEPQGDLVNQRSSTLIHAQGVGDLEDTFNRYWFFTDCQIWFYDKRLLSVSRCLEVLSGFSNKKLDKEDFKLWYLKRKTNQLIPEPLQDKSFEVCGGCIRRWIAFDLTAEDQCRAENQMQVKITGEPCVRFKLER